MPAEPAPTMEVEIFDPPLCCPTGLCGPVLDTTLLDLADTVATLAKEGHSVVRHMMTSDPQAFMRNRTVYELVRARQLEVLPITLVRGEVVKTSAYPTLEELHAALSSPARTTLSSVG